MIHLAVDFAIQADTIEETLRRLDTATSPEALAIFMGASIDPYIRGRASARFAQEGDDVTGRWEPLSPATVRIREEKGFGGEHPINRRTGDLEEYITGERSLIAPIAGGASMIAPGRKASGELQHKMEVAQTGVDAHAARPVVGMNEQDLAAVLLLVSGYFTAVEMTR
jgi:hypothetical protein